ncbi:hypothetical protein [Aurantimonas endophytica]|uniref:Uncharacterized protein n=1 Tax=Aurantimonas endophytica TaxID=1522175 RepID=A0A7W6HCV7_9HYPH|nr:hypothetical protein [Aurantimonas endophytica]MBB4002638.1 hypothetical protein [Aurantimonas endophytica]MCO6403518.1 hypothetical protein [Aurantimonas endophytica]
MDLQKLIEAAAAAAEAVAAEEAAAAADVPFVFSWQRAVSVFERAGEIDIAAKTLIAARREGKRPEASAAVEDRAKHLQAENKAAVYREINKQNGTNDPLPAWIANTIGEKY